MKRIATIIAAVAFIAVASTSCKSHERCPAYGKVNPNTTSEARV